MIGRRLGDYELVEELGRGSMGVVYGALQLSSHRPVAVKVLAAHLAADREFVRRFEREANAIARLDHPGIVKAYEVGREGETYYFAMQLVSGPSLEDVLLDRLCLEPRQVASLGIQVAGALGYAHRQGLLHRDVKPGNLMLDSEGHWLITDFGIALVEAETRLTRTGQSLGSPHYVAPEIIRGGEADSRSDVYSLGIVLFQALTGELPYRGPNAFVIIEQHLDGPLARVRDRDRAIPGELDRIVARLMARDPSDRYQTGDEVARELLRLTDGETPPLSTQPAVPRAPAAETDSGPRRRSRSRRVLAVALTALAIAFASYLASRAACAPGATSVSGAGSEGARVPSTR